MFACSLNIVMFIFTVALPAYSFKSLFSGIGQRLSSALAALQQHVQCLKLRQDHMVIFKCWNVTSGTAGRWATNASTLSFAT